LAFRKLHRDRDPETGLSAAQKGITLPLSGSLGQEWRDTTKQLSAPHLDQAWVFQEREDIMLGSVSAECVDSPFEEPGVTALRP
jgi:hypothetical protein